MLLHDHTAHAPNCTLVPSLAGEGVNLSYPGRSQPKMSIGNIVEWQWRQSRGASERVSYRSARYVTRLGWCKLNSYS